MNLLARLESALAVFAPRAARDRMLARLQFRALAGVHEATRPGRNRRMARDQGSANRIVSMDAATIRDQARALDRDHDIATNALNILEQNIVGSGIGVEPAPRLPGQPVDRDLARQLADLWGDFWVRPEVTGRMDLAKAQRLLCRTWMRDGEAMFQRLKGPVAFLDHGTDVPYSLELFEPDMVPLDLNDEDKGIAQGLQLNAWDRITGYCVFKRHPGDGLALREEYKIVPADRIGHIALTTRLHQRRGLSVFSSVIARLADLKEYEDAERIAAKVAASMTAFIKKDANLAGETGSLNTLDPGAGTGRRDLQLRPGAIFDDLLPGEDVGVIKSDRPNPNLVTWRGGQLRAASGGLRVSNSSLSKNYDGSYSAQRQELVEQWGAYALLTEEFVDRVVRVIYRDFVEVAVLSGLVRLPRGWQLRHLAAASYIRPTMPWIDPLKEVLSMGELVDREWMAPQQAIRRRGERPADVLDLLQDWQQQRAERGLPEAPAANAADSATRAQLRIAAVRAAATRDTE